MRDKKYFAYKEMTYNRKHVDAGQLLDAGNHPNTQKMINLGGYIGDVTSEYPCPTCARCGNIFIMENYLEAHQRTCPEVEVDLTNVEAADTTVAEAIGA